MQRNGVLIIFGGLPGVGKTTLAKALAAELNAALRIDTIEQQLIKLNGLNVGNEGYLIAYEIAADNLRAGNIVIADSVNSTAITRDAWTEIARCNQVPMFEIEVICSDKNEHRNRVEGRQADISGHEMPQWQDVIKREYETWDSKNLTVDTAGVTPSHSLKIIIDSVKSTL